MTGILIYSGWPVFGHIPLSQANVKPLHSKPTLVTSKLKHDITHHLPRSLPLPQLTWTRSQMVGVEVFSIKMQAGAGNAESIKKCASCAVTRVINMYAYT